VRSLNLSGGQDPTAGQTKDAIPPVWIQPGEFLDQSLWVNKFEAPGWLPASRLVAFDPCRPSAKNEAGDEPAKPYFPTPVLRSRAPSLSRGGGGGCTTGNSAPLDCGIIDRSPTGRREKEISRTTSSVHRHTRHSLSSTLPKQLQQPRRPTLHHACAGGKPPARCTKPINPVQFRAAVRRLTRAATHMHSTANRHSVLWLQERESTAVLDNEFHRPRIESTATPI
jgi:hypothetical protein